MSHTLWLCMVDTGGIETMFPYAALLKVVASGSQTHVYLVDGTVVEVDGDAEDVLSFIRSQVAVPGEAYGVIQWPVAP